MRKLSLAHLSAIELSPPELVQVAARVGFDAVGLRLIAVNDASPGYALMDDARLMRATKSALHDCEIAVQDIEFVRVTPELSHDPDALLPFLDCGAELGAQQVICAPYDPDLARLSDSLAWICDAAAGRGIGTLLEFFPWTNVPDLATCHTVVQQAGDVGILVDALHFDRSGSAPGDLAQIAPQRLPMLHLCDAMRAGEYSTDELLFTAREARLPPGQGQIDLAAIIAAMPPECPVGVEVPMAAAQRRHGVEYVLRQCHDGARALLE